MYVAGYLDCLLLTHNERVPPLGKMFSFCVHSQSVSVRTEVFVISVPRFCPRSVGYFQKERSSLYFDNTFIVLLVAVVLF